MRRPKERSIIALGRRATGSDLDSVPDGYIGEIVDGELIVRPRPPNPHAVVRSELSALLSLPFRFGVGGPGGWIFASRQRVPFGDDIRVPDLAGWRREAEGAPGWIGEVLSPTIEAEIRGEKMATYHRGGVTHVWLVGWMTRTLEVYRRAGEGWTQLATFTGQNRIRAQPFEAVEIDVAPLWASVPA